MALVLPDLVESLRKVFSGAPSSPAQAAQQLAQAYGDYAKNAQTVVGGALPLFVPGGAEPTGEVSALAGVLLPSISTPATGNAASVAAAWTSGITAFWLTPPVVFGAGLVTAVVAPALTTSLQAVFSNVQNTHQTAAAQTAAALHAATLGVTVTLPGPIVTTVI